MDSIVRLLLLICLLLLLLSFWISFRVLGRPGEKKPRHFKLRVVGVLALWTLLFSGFGAILVWIARPGEEERLRLQAQTALEESGWTMESLFGANLVVGSPEHLTHEMIQHLARLDSPSTLFINAPEFDDEMLETLDEQNALKETWLLNLSGPRVSDRAVKTILTMPKLEYLVLDHTQLTDDGLWQLRTSTRLKALSIVGTQTTQAGIQRFRRARPKVQIDREEEVDQQE